MGKIVITVKDESKLELLKNFLESVDYVKIEKIESIYNNNSNFINNNFIKLLNVVCKYDYRRNRFIKPQTIINDYPELLEHLISGKNNEVSFARNIAKFLFGGEANKPQNPDDFIEHLSLEGKKLIDHVQNNYISFHAIGHALKIRALKPWCVSISEVNEFIEEKLLYWEPDRKLVDVNNKLIDKPEFLKFFETRTSENRSNHQLHNKRSNKSL